MTNTKPLPGTADTLKAQEPNIKVLVICAEGGFHQFARNILLAGESPCFKVYTEHDPTAWLQYICRYKPGIVLLGETFKEPYDGTELVLSRLSSYPEVEGRVIVVSSGRDDGEIGPILKAYRNGAVGYFEPPGNPEKMVAFIKKVHREAESHVGKAAMSDGALAFIHSNGLNAGLVDRVVGTG